MMANHMPKPDHLTYTLKDRAQLYHESYPDYPPLTYWQHDKTKKEWLYGIWAIGNCYRSAHGYHGEYPHGYLKRVMCMFPDCKDILHLFSGAVDDSEPGIKVDISMRGDVCCDAHRLPFRGGTFHLVLADPPYTKPDGRIYQSLLDDRYSKRHRNLCRMPNRRIVLQEVARTLKPGGFLVWLDTIKPMFRKLYLDYCGIIGIDRSTNNCIRATYIFRRTEEPYAR